MPLHFNFLKMILLFLLTLHSQFFCYYDMVHWVLETGHIVFCDKIVNCCHLDSIRRLPLNLSANHQHAYTLLRLFTWLQMHFYRACADCDGLSRYPCVDHFNSPVVRVYWQTHHLKIVGFCVSHFVACSLNANFFCPRLKSWESFFFNWVKHTQNIHWVDCLTNW